MGFLDRHTDVEGGEHCEDKCLNVGHETFKQRDEHAEEDADHADGATDNGTKHVAEDEDDDDESEDNDMARSHIGKKSNHEHNRLGEHSNQLNHRHQREDFQPCRHTRGVENVNPIMAIAADIGDQEGDNSQGGGDSNIAGDIGTGWEERYQAKDIAEENKEEKGEQIRQIFPIFVFANHGSGNTVADKHH